MIRQCILLFSAMSMTAEPADLEKLRFMSGCWTTEGGPLSIEEHWSKPAAGAMLGYGRTVKAGRMVFFEFMRLESKGADIVYTPRLGTSQPPVAFRLIKLSAAEAVFENPAHDFPQRILYTRKGDNLLARIEGLDKGKQRAEDFAYRRATCD